MKFKWTLRFAAVGFLIAATLCVYTFYANSHNGPMNEGFYLLLCPPSIFSMALGDVRAIAGICGWLIIAFMNGVLYAIPGFILDRVVGLSPRPESH